MKNLMLLYNLIKSNGDEEEIKQKLMNLENPEDQSSVSTNVENIENEDKKLNEKIKNSQNVSPIKDEQNLNTEDNEKKNIYSKGDISLITKEKELLQENKLNMDMDKEDIDKDQDKLIEKDKNKILNLVLPIFLIQNRFNLLFNNLLYLKIQ